MLGTLALVTVTTLGSRATRAAVSVIAAVVIAVAGASRVYLGVHWATDVLTGWLLGGAWVAVGAALLLRADGASSGAAVPAAPLHRRALRR